MHLYEGYVKQGGNDDISGCAALLEAPATLSSKEHKPVAKNPLARTVQLERMTSPEVKLACASLAGHAHRAKLAKALPGVEPLPCSPQEKENHAQQSSFWSRVPPPGNCQCTTYLISQHSSIVFPQTIARNLSIKVARYPESRAEYTGLAKSKASASKFWARPKPLSKVPRETRNIFCISDKPGWRAGKKSGEMRFFA
jgi:hypothetical protein